MGVYQQNLSKVIRHVPQVVVEEKVSIITPVYNGEKYISEMIESIMRQTYQNWELLITDDNSTDNTVDIIKEYQRIDDRIFLYQLNENLGAGSARNYSIKQAKGRYISFCDADDMWIPEKLKHQVDFMESESLSFTYSSYHVMDEDGRLLSTIKAPIELTYSMMLKNNYVGCLTAIYDSERLGKIFMSTLRRRQDWILWLEVFSVIGKSKGISLPLAIYRKRSNSLSSSRLLSLRYTWLVYRNARKYTFMQSGFYTLRFLYYYILKYVKNLNS